MATSKRERQRANREAKLAEEKKIQRKQSIFQRSKRIAVWVLVGIVLFVLANLIFGGSADAAAFAPLIG
jgi:cell division septal protein FtsQ